MAEHSSQERLQPALLDRLIDEDPDNRQPEPREARLISKSRLREAVLRDLAWLLNAVRLAPREELAGLDHVARSVVNFGLPALSGETASSLDVLRLEEAVREAVTLYEPRILPSTLDVRAVVVRGALDNHNVVGIEIHGSLWAHPIPLEMLIRTEVDLETGEVRIHDADAPGLR